MSCAHRDSTSSCASAVRAWPPMSSGRPGQRRAEHQDVAGVRVRRPRLGVQVVAVVPDGEQPRVGDRRVSRCPRPDHRADAPSPHREPAPVPLGRAQVGAQRHVPSGSHGRQQRRVDPREVPGVRQHDHRAAPGRQCHAHGVGQPRRPVLPRQRRPHGPRRAALGHRGEERRARPVLPPAVRADRRRGREVRRREDGRGRLRPGVPRRHAQPCHVDERAGPPVGDGAEQAARLRGQDRPVADHPLEPRQSALVRGAG